MSLQKNQNIKKTRKKLDLIDNKILNLIKKRTSLVDRILSEKKFKNQIIDKKRIKIILKNIKRKSKAKRIDTDLTRRVWSSMIRGYINYEIKKFKKK